ncbi:maleylpyruvate isomerase family mycothiol-dependent enzyme [Marinactinospora rubrisoli]|uniref:Maleylpyruvate isomerase family mycothiol-dependent enzyme n=1 Tax=Marinactinospora rubrisoli TaxID=2715399 RepID=A0ABW2KHI0_9ACTN
MTLSYDRYRAEIAAQTGLLREHVAEADLATRVPSCPGWNLAELLGHVGGAHRWAETAVRTRSTEPVPDDLVNDVAGYAGTDRATLDAWLTEGAARLTEALRATPPDTPVWTPTENRTPMFWARRMTHETLMHRADAALALGLPFTVAGEVALDALDEWTEYGTYPEAVGPGDGTPSLLGPGRTLTLRATNTDAHWFIDLTGPAATRHRTTTPPPAAATARGTLTDLLFLVYDRPLPEGRVERTGDSALLEEWLTRARFWLG